MKNRIVLLLLIPVLFTRCSEDKSNSINGFSVDQHPLNEGNTSTTINLVITAEGTVFSGISVAYELKEGTALFGSDILASGGELAFDPGNQQVTLPIDLIADTSFELTEDFDLLLTFEGKTTVFSFLISDDDPIEPILEDQDGFYTPADYPSMTKRWSDEFDGTTLNSDYWTYELGNGCDVGICGWGNNELESYTNDVENLSLSNGVMSITARENTGNFSSARIITKGKIELTFGRIDIRARITEGQGIWPAIWMLGNNIDEVGWPASGEIDIMESIGNLANVVHGTVHYDNGGYQTTTGTSSLDFENFSDKFHVFSIVWDRDIITWYIDNKSYKIFTRTTTSGYPFNSPFFFIINVAVGGNWPGPPDSTTVFPQVMEVDYIRTFH